MKRTKTEFKVLPAFNGDCILIKTFNQSNEEIIILIDGGTASTYNYSLKEELRNIQKIDLIVLTHIDSDHIGGLKKLFQSTIIESIDVSEIWVNFPNKVFVTSGEEISFDQADTLATLIQKKKPNSIVRCDISSGLLDIVVNDIRFKILSPSENILQQLHDSWPDKQFKDASIPDQDGEISSSLDSNSLEKTLKEHAEEEFKPTKKVESDIVNASSISFLIECPDCKLLLLADSRPEIICKSLNDLGFDQTTNKLSVDFVKVSHHGSSNNTSNELLDLIDCNNYVISTNGGSAKDMHPSREVIGRLIFHPSRGLNVPRTIYLNYGLDAIQNKRGNFLVEKDYEEGNWTIVESRFFSIES